MGYGNFRPPRESTPLNRLPKIVTGDYVGDPYTAVPNFVHIRPWELMGECVKYDLILYLCPSFPELTYRSDTLTDFRARWLKRHGLAQGCALLGFVDMAPHLGGQIPPKPQFGGVNRRFKPNS